MTIKGGWHVFREIKLEAFNKAKELVLSGGMLGHYSPYLPTWMETDASDGVVAGVLSQQQDNGEWKPITFFTRAIAIEEIHYKIYNKELLTII